MTLNRPANTDADRPWLAYLQLLRLPNVFTAWADVSMGYLLATEGHASWRVFVFVFVPLIICSSSLYLAGMVLNDVCDYAQDCRQRPQRPLPSGRIDRRQAAALGSLLWVLGLAAGWTASWSLGVWHCGAVATTLAGCVLVYDLGGKRTVLGPPLMGACRSLNILLGMVCTLELGAPWDLPTSWLGVAAAIGVYVAGITWFARQEAGISRRSHLLAATTVMACGILLLAGYAILDAADGSRALRWADPWIWPLLLLLLTVPVWRRCALAIGQPSAARIQAAVKHAILTLILLDAAICLATVGHLEALAVLSLSLPFLVLGHWVYST